MRRRVRVPTRLQFQTTECGVAALAMVLAHHGKHVPTSEIRRVTGVSRDCMNAADMARAARHFGLECRAYRREVEDLRSLEAPYVVHIRFIHFMVAEGMTDTHLLVNDPHAGRQEVPLEKFSEAFTGVVLTFTPSMAFERDGRPIAAGSALAARIPLGARVLAGLALGAGLALPVPLVMFAFLLGSAVDSGVFPFALLGAVALRGALRLLQSAAFAELARRLSVSEAGAMARQLLAVPYAFFAYRLPSRLHATLYSGDLVAKVVCEDGVLPAFTRALGALLLISATAFVHPPAAWALAAASAAYLIAVAVLARWRSGDERSHRAYADEELRQLAWSASRIESVKLGTMDRDFVVGGLGAAANQQGGFQRFAVAARGAHAAGAVLEYATAALALLLGAAQVAAGVLTPGDALVLVVLAWACGLALHELAAVRGRLDHLRHALLHVEDVHAEAVDTSAAPPATAAPEHALELRKVVFGYAAMKPPLIRDASLAVARGEQLGITGPSGGGKSTLVGVLVGLHCPSAGDILTQPGHRVAWIDKTPFFFEGTVLENLQLWQPDFDAAALEDALGDACVDEVLAARPGGVSSRVEAQARNFSGGQQQRLELARALLRRPTLLVLDEATDALDPALEARIRTNLRRRGCTLVIVSHRASTLAACDRVIHVAGGRIVEACVAPAEPFMQAEQEAPAAPRPVDPAPVVAAFRSVALALDERVSMPEDLRTGTAFEVLDALAAHNGFALRRVRFTVRESWRRDHGPLIAFLRGSGRAVALLPHGDRYRIVDADGKVLAAVPGEATLADEACALYARPRELGSSSWPLFSSGWRRARGDLWRAAALSVPLAFAAATLPAVAAGVFAHPGPSSQLASAALVLAGAAVVVALLETARMLALLRFEGRLELSMLAALQAGVARILPAFARSAPPELLSRGIAGVPRWMETLRGEPLRLGLGLAVTAACLGWLALQSAQLAAWAFALCLPALGAAPLIARLAREIDERLLHERAAARRLLMDLLYGFARLRLLRRAPAALAAWLQDYGAEKRLEARVRRWRAWQAVLEDVYPWLALVAFAAVLLDAVPAASAVPLLIAAWLALRSATQGGAFLAALVRSRPLARHVDALIAAPCDHRSSAAPASRAALEARELSYRYPGTTRAVLDGVSLRVDPGELVGIAGPSGSGKSTLLRLLLAFDRPDAGVVKWGSEPLDALDIQRWRARIAAVFQDDRLEQASTLRSQVSGCAMIGIQDVWRAARIAAVDADIRAMPMGMQTIVEGNRVSTGQEQRILIARALARRPSLLVLDEAINAIPEALQARVLDNLRVLGITSLLVTHRESALARCDRIFLLEDGRVVWSGPPQGLSAQQRVLERLRQEQQEATDGR
ncbi:MAG: ATP-binding cassette domain-containing protein [Betaproteobacteria bacterium]